MNLYEERLNRIRAAVELEPVDQIPTVSGSIAFSCTAAGTLMKDYLDDMELNCTTNLKAADMIGNLDALQAALYTCEQLPPIWLSEVRRAGRELPDHELWQVAEKELIHQSDYDEILKNGFAPWYNNYLTERLHYDFQTAMGPFVSYMPTALQRAAEAGYPVINGGAWCSPFEMICGGRSLTAFLVDDLLEIPDKVEQVFDVIHRFNMERYEDSLKNGHKPIGIWVGGWRGTPETLSPAMFERFSWKYMREIIELLISYDVIPILHLDACWNLGLHYFRDLPAKKCIMALDGKTDIFKAKEIVGDRMCIMGDVPAEMLAFGTADNVYQYVEERVKRVGPTGYIVCSGCDIPYNAKLENVQAMYKAAKESAVR